ncbi:MAG TPA: hypothetical protein VMS17_16235 [Gemmataceae bacterium]|nr:hypothetical protein [Gemmataceae bacterium]
MSDHPESRNGAVNPSVKYEPTDLSLRAVVTFSVVLAVVIAVVAAGMWFLIPGFLGSPPQQAPQPAWSFEPQAKPDVSHLSAPPELEGIQRQADENRGAAPPVSIQEQIADEEDRLNKTGKYEKTEGTIPIKQAMKHIVQQQGGKP